MHSDPESALAILQQVEARTSSRFGLFKNRFPDHLVKVACDTLSKGDPKELLPILASRVWSIDGEIRNEVSTVFLKLALRLPLSAWPKLDEDLRKFGVLPRTVKPNDAPAEIITAACHPSGFVREKAIQLFPRIPPLIASCLLLIRVNDWVESIRLLARRSLAQSLALLDPVEKMRTVPLLQRLHECGRHGEAEAIGRWTVILTEPFDEQSWLDSWQQCAAKDRRIYISLLQNRNEMPGPSVRDALLRSHNRFALVWYVRRILPYLESDEYPAAVYILSKEGAVHVRREWIGTLIKSSPSEAIQRLINSLTDKSRSLRSFARFHLTELAPMDFVAHYRRLLKDPHHEAGALAGLAELAPEEAHSEALTRLQSEVPSIRKAAILALNKNSLSEQLDWLLEEAGSFMPGIAKVARKRLLQIPSSVGSHLLSHPHQFMEFAFPLQKFFVRAAPAFGKWIALEFLLRCTGSPSLLDTAKTSFQVWAAGFNRSFANIPNAKRPELINLVQTASLDQSLRDFLLFILEGAE